MFARRPWLPIALVATVWIALYFTQSRTSYLLAAFVFVLAVASAPAEERVKSLWQWGRGLALAGICVFGLISLLSYRIDVETAALTQSGADASACWKLSIGTGTPEKTALLKSKFTLKTGHASSDAMRRESIDGAVQLWIDRPIFGAGLGGFVESRRQAGQSFLVVHSVPFWLLAETGALGLLLVGAALFLFLRQGAGQLSDSATSAWGVGLLALIFSFAAAGLVHDVFYQRAFWFLLGLFAVAVPRDSRQASGEQATEAR